MKKRRASLRSPYKYQRSGLSNVHLAGITVYECNRCDLVSPVIPNMEQLHDAIARSLALKAGPLSGEEIRYLRKWAGLPAKSLAAFLRIGPEHLSKIEKGHIDKLSGAADTLVRALAVASREGGNAVGAVLFRVAQEVFSGAEELPLFKLQGSRWKAAA